MNYCSLLHLGDSSGAFYLIALIQSLQKIRKCTARSVLQSSLRSVLSPALFNIRVGYSKLRLSKVFNKTQMMLSAIGHCSTSQDKRLRENRRKLNPERTTAVLGGKDGALRMVLNGVGETFSSSLIKTSSCCAILADRKTS